MANEARTQLSLVGAEEALVDLRRSHSFDGGGGGGYDDGMEARVTKLEADLTAIKIDLAVIKTNGAAKSDIADLRAVTKSDIAELRAVTKVDVAELKTAIADAKSAIVMWVVSVIVLAQVLPSILKFASDLLK